MRKTVIHFIGLILLITSYSVNAKTITAKKWETIDTSFAMRAEVSNPFEVDLSCTFTNERSEALIVPGFYNGNKQWLVRFTPNRTGKWKCGSKSSVKSMAKG